MGIGTRSIYLHIGPPKTGTTFLQSVLWAARPQLVEQGLTLPMQSAREHLHVTDDVRDRDRSPEAVGALDRFAASLHEMDTPRALFSMETIVGATPEQIERFYAALSGFDIHIIVTARDLARQIPALWQQSLRHKQFRRRRSDLPYDAFLRDLLDDPELAHPVWRRQDLSEVARRWGARLPPDRIHIVTVPPSGSPQRLLLERFCGVIGVDPEQIDTSVAGTNPSLRAPQAELLRRVNEALGDRSPARVAEKYPLVKTYFAMTVLAAQSGPPLKLPVRYADRARELYGYMAQEIRDQGYDVAGDLADLEPTVFSAADADQGEPDASDANVAEAGVQALATILEQRHEDLELNRALRQRLRAARAATRGATRAHKATWVRRQRRRVDKVRQDPALLAKRLRRSRPWL